MPGRAGGFRPELPVQSSNAELATLSDVFIWR